MTVWYWPRSRTGSPGGHRSSMPTTLTKPSCWQRTQTDLALLAFLWKEDRFDVASTCVTTATCRLFRSASQMQIRARRSSAGGAGLLVKPSNPSIVPGELPSLPALAGQRLSQYAASRHSKQLEARCWRLHRDRGWVLIPAFTRPATALNRLAALPLPGQTLEAQSEHGCMRGGSLAASDALLKLDVASRPATIPL